MRKNVLPSSNASTNSAPSGGWFNLDGIAVAEISSEDPAHPFESALDETTEVGWRAAHPGPQLIRLKFDTPQLIRRLRLVIKDNSAERSQELAVFASSPGAGRKQVLRQQWNFSPGGSNTEVEDSALNLPEVSVLELEIDPGRHDNQQFATLQFLGIA